MTTMTADRTLLILADDPLVAALLGAFFGEEATVVFAEAGETFEGAARRIQPRVIVTDRVDLLTSGASAITVVFGSPEDCARHRAAGIRCFALPADMDALHAHVFDLLDTVAE